MKIPPEAKRVFKGVIFDVYQWEQKMFDGSTATFERLKRPGTVEVIPVSGDKIVLAREQQPGTDEAYTFLGGRQEDGEEPLESAKRELLEESGLASDDWELFRTYEPVGKMDWTIYVYIARGCRKVADQHLDAGEKISLVEVGFEEFVEKTISSGFWEKESSNELYRMKHEGKLEDFRKQLGV